MPCCELPTVAHAKKSCLEFRRASISLKTTIPSLPYFNPASDNVVTLSRRLIKQVLNRETVPIGFGVIK